MENLKTQVIITGGGLVGLTLAIALCRANIDVVVIEKQLPEDTINTKTDGRASAISSSSIELLKAISVWEHVKASQPILDIRITDGSSKLFVHYNYNEYGGKPFGEMVENTYIKAALIESARKIGVEILIGSVENIKSESSFVNVILNSGKNIKAQLLIGADGAKSKIRELSGIKSKGWDYKQAGIVLSISHEKPHSGIAHERFLPSGPFAILPLPGNRSSLVWTEKIDLAPLIMKLNEKDFMEELESRIGIFLGKISQEGARWSYPLTLRQSTSYIEKRIALAGDAAHVIHPIAGQGLNLGFRDAAALAEVIVDAHRLGLDVGNSLVLKKYQRWRKFDSTTMVAVTDSLNKLFSNDKSTIRISRDLGLGLVNQITPLKQLLVTHARGSFGNIPKLLTGQSL